MSIYIIAQFKYIEIRNNLIWGIKKIFLQQCSFANYNPNLIMETHYRSRFIFSLGDRGPSLNLPLRPLNIYVCYQRFSLRSISFIKSLIPVGISQTTKLSIFSSFQGFHLSHYRIFTICHFLQLFGTWSFRFRSLCTYIPTTLFLTQIFIPITSNQSDVQFYKSPICSGLF